MAFNREIESCLEQIRDLEKSFQDAIESEILPLSFFSSNYDRLSVLKQHLHKVEEVQYLQMQEHLQKKDAEEVQEYPRIIAPELIEEAEPAAVGFLGEKIAKTLYADIKKSLSLNDSFRFQRELFEGNASLMERTLDYLNDSHSMQDASVYLRTHLAWNWDDEIVCDFVKILEKRFS